MHTKQKINSWLLSLLMAMTCPALLFAQDDRKIDINVDLDGPEPQWYEQPWVWVVGGAVFILLLVALLRGGRKG